MSVVSISHEPKNLRFSAGVTIDFSNSISFASGDRLGSFRNLLVTTQPANSPVFGGIEDTSLGNAAYFYNSSPFGNCGLLNGVGAAYMSYTFGAKFRYRYSTFGHVITEIDFGDGWHIIESYGRDGVNNLVDNTTPPGGNPFYTLAELQQALFNGDPTGIWLGIGETVRNYYGASGHKIVDAPAGISPYTNTQWNKSTFRLAGNESAVFRRAADHSLSDLYGLGAVAPFDGTVPDGMRWAAVTRRTPAGASGFERIESNWAITDVKLELKPGASVPSFFPAMAYDALKIYPVAPIGTVALPGFVPRTPQDWQAGWTVTAGSFLDAVRGGIMRNAGGGESRVRWNSTFTNQTAAAVRLWVPVAFRTDTPTGTAGEAPVATLRAGSERVALTATTMDLQYRDAFFTVAPGQTVDLELTVAAGRSMQVLALGTATNIFGMLSPESRAQAVDVDLSGIASLRDSFNIRYGLAGTATLVPTGLAPNDVLNAPAEATPASLEAHPLNEMLVTRRQLATSPLIERIETPYLVEKVRLVAKGATSFDVAAAEAKLRVFAAPPSWAVAMPGFVRASEQDWQPNYTLTRGRLRDTGEGVLFDNPDGGSGDLVSRLAYTNRTASLQYLWIPIAYRTDTPSRPGDGSPVAYFAVGQQLFNFYATDLDVHYKGLIVSVEPGVTVTPRLTLLSGRSLEIYALGTSTDISDFLSPENPAQAIDVDFSRLAAAGLGAYRNHVDLDYALMVNPYLSNEVLTGTAGNDTITGSDAPNVITGGAGDDVLDGAGGSDKVDGGPGNDLVYWDPADNVADLRGGTGFDVLMIRGSATPAMNLAAQGFEAARQTILDTANSNAWSQIVNSYGPGWVLQAQHGTYDDGSRWIARHDVKGDQAWSQSIEYFDRQGRVSGNFVRRDGGTSYGTVRDAGNSQPYSSYTTYSDAQGRQTGVQYNEDDGSAYATKFDPADIYGWSTVAEYANAAGARTAVRTDYDDGRSVYTRYDPTNALAWSTLIDYLDAAGRQTAQAAFYDDGTSVAAYWDVGNAYSWRFQAIMRDRAGITTRIYGERDDGSSFST